MMERHHRRCGKYGKFVNFRNRPLSWRMAVSHVGVCSADGWAAQGVGPNCTFVGRRGLHHSTLLIGSCARNVRQALEQHAQAWVTSFLDVASASGGHGGSALIFEDEQRAGDPDGTRAALRDWAARDSRIRLLLAQPLLYPRWSRTQRLALCRNMLAHEAARLPEQGVYVALDLDCHTPPAAEIATILASMRALSWDVLTANTKAPAFYYDRWALRSSTLTLDYDCWFNATQRRARGSCPEYAITIDPAAPTLAVDSAFNGLGLYRASAVRRALAASCRYRGTKNSYMCEHVPFHLCMRAAALSIGVLPSLAVSCGPTTVAPKHKRVALLANGTVRVTDRPRMTPSETTRKPKRRSRTGK